MSILRAYDDAGVDVRFLYDPSNIFDIKKKQLQEDYLLNASLQEIVDKIDRKIDSIKESFKISSSLYPKTQLLSVCTSFINSSIQG